MREFPLHKLTIRYNGTMFTYDLPCGSSPYINWLYGTMPQCLRTIYHGSSPYTKLTIRYSGTMFTYDLPCGSSPYINWLYGTMRYNVYVRFTMLDIPCGSSPYINWLYGTMVPPCLRTIYHPVSSPYINWLYGTMAQCLRTIYHAGVPLT